MMMRSLILLAAFTASPVFAQNYPPLQGRPVVDAAEVIPQAREDQLNQRLLQIQRQTNHQVAVVTVRSLDGHSVETYANGLYRHYRLGDAVRNDGVLLLVSTGDRKIRIEVGYGLEGVLTDLRATDIIRNSIGPELRAGDYPTGIEAGVSEIEELITPEVVTPVQKAQQDSRRSSGSGILWWFLGVLSLGAIAIWWGVARSRRRYRLEMEEAENRRERTRQVETELYRPYGGRTPDTLDDVLASLGVTETGRTPSANPKKSNYPKSRKFQDETPFKESRAKPPPPPPPSSWSPPPSPPPSSWSSPPPPPPSSGGSDFSGGGGSSGGGGGSGDF